MLVEPSNFAQLNVDRSSLSIAKGFIVSLYKDFASKKQGDAFWGWTSSIL